MEKLDGTVLLDFFQPILDKFIEMGNSAMERVPQITLGLILLIALLIVGKVLRFVARNLCSKLRLDGVAERVGITELLSKIGINAPLSRVIGNVVYWIIALVAFKAAADIWNIKDVSKFIDSLILFLPKLFVAVFILFAGLLVAELAKNAIRTALDRVGVDYAGPISNVVYGLFAVMIMTVVLGLLGIETELLNSTVVILLGAFALAVALSLGLGLRPIAKNIVSGVYARDLFPPGSILEIDDSMAVVREVGAVATRLESDNGVFFVVPNSTLVEQVNRGKNHSMNLAGKE